ncbi:GAF and ANTAR domain-containing protein [Modestobacter sp. VKM Ac-2986]|uniref:GAF and ANTAR domain-containing protein n=1 Tax=Modestobacter sp. VKM Ac-2986 TaxID=3004140 RepID=UPI0022AB94F1|nr:GAF and ANTAR domain-containing protein [Modestobacter sp. VKM Ac-2986]MCZ2830330.1 GAF and ANTAR domain-containing protein [Modestobacter sp. VKM Ac-2986]
MPHADRRPSLSTAQALEQLAGLPLQDTSTAKLLQTVADLTQQVVPGGVEASVTLLDGQRPTTAATTGPLSAALDEAQYASDQGPCLHSAVTGEPIEVADTRSESRWAAFVQQALAHGTLSSLSVPLPISTDLAGSLNIYAPQVGAFTDEARSAAVRLASYAAGAARNVRDYEATQTLVERLRTELERDDVVHQAEGMVIERHDVSAEAAHHLLTEAAGRAGSTVQHVAARLVGTGELPDCGPADAGP